MESNCLFPKLAPEFMDFIHVLRIRRNLTIKDSSHFFGANHRIIRISAQAILKTVRCFEQKKIKKTPGVMAFAIYSLESTQGKGLGVEKRALKIVEAIAEREMCGILELQTYPNCGVEDYYMNRGFEKTSETDALVSMRREIV